MSPLHKPLTWYKFGKLNMDSLFFIHSEMIVDLINKAKDGDISASKKILELLAKFLRKEKQVPLVLAEYVANAIDKSLEEQDKNNDTKTVAKILSKELNLNKQGRQRKSNRDQINRFIEEKINELHISERQASILTSVEFEVSESTVKRIHREESEKAQRGVELDPPDMDQIIMDHFEEEIEQAKKTGDRKLELLAILKMARHYENKELWVRCKAELAHVCNDKTMWLEVQDNLTEIYGEYVTRPPIP